MNKSSKSREVCWKALCYSYITKKLQYCYVNVTGKPKKAVNETFYDGFGEHPSLRRQFPEFGIYLTYKGY
jgi:hypothetical protein